ncbi:porin family protein [Massilia horti]|nr:porin family protein [Massilia horti]
MKKLIFALIAGVAAMGAAQAQSTTAGRGYVGIGVATADHSYPSIVQGATDIKGDGYKASAKIFGGYDFNQNYGVEAGYTDFRRSDVSYSQGGIAHKGSDKGYGMYVAGKAMLPINEQLSAYGKLGVAYSERELNETSGLKTSRHDTGAYAGLGLQYNLTKEVALTGEYERYGKTKSFGAKADVWTVGAKYSF